ncbi:small integral membrane protein 8 isoform X2 [Caretta caretta]|uniref:small integral membrane protein 8 isoform X2 n=1 Tax=Caretta caretta TaxID=8467 RepID=UPI003F4B6BC2
MSSAPEPPNIKKEAPKEKDSRIPGLRGVRTTTLFRAVNPELFIKPDTNLGAVLILRSVDNAARAADLGDPVLAARAESAAC